MLSPFHQPTLRFAGGLLDSNRQHDPNQPANQLEYVVMITCGSGRETNFELGHHADGDEPALNPPCQHVSHLRLACPCERGLVDQPPEAHRQAASITSGSERSRVAAAKLASRLDVDVPERA